MHCDRDQRNGYYNSISSTHQAKISTHDDNSIDEETTFTVLETDDNSQRWLIESGATSHMAQNKAVFVIVFSWTCLSPVLLPMGHMVQVVKKSIVQLQIKTDYNKTIHLTHYNALHMTYTETNLF